MNGVPDLERHCGSWVAIDRATGQGVFETFSRAIAEAIDQKRYRVVTALQYLANLQREIDQ